MKKITLALIFSLLSLNAYAEDKVDKNMAVEFLKLSKYEEVINASISQYEKQLFAAAKPEEKARYHDMLVDSMGWDAVKGQLANIVMNLYTREEIEASITFMKSPVGASAAAKSEDFSRQFTNVIAANMQKVFAKLRAENK